MRRKDKEITDKNEMESIINDNTVCRLGLSENDTPYIIPLNYGYQTGVLYFHSFKAGKKLDIIKNNAQACFEISDTIKVLEAEAACDFGTRYKSVLGSGTIEIVTDETEKIEGLNIIMQHHTRKARWEYGERAVKNVVILKMTIKEMTGKKSGF